MIINCDFECQVRERQHKLMTLILIICLNIIHMKYEMIMKIARNHVCTPILSDFLTTLFVVIREARHYYHKVFILMMRCNR